MSGKRNAKTRRAVSEEFVNFAVPEVHQWERASGWTRQMGINLQAEAVEDSGNHITRFDRSISGSPTDGVAGTHDLPTLHTTTGKTNRKTLRPVVTPAGWIDSRRTTEFREIADECIVQQTTLLKVFDQGGISLIVERCHDIPHALDGSKWF